MNTNQNLQIDDQSKSYLLETAKWGKFLAIVGFVMCGFLVLIGMFFGSFMSKLMSMGGGMQGVDMPEATKMMGPIMAVVYVVIAALYLIPCLYLFKFATAAKSGLLSNNQEMMTDSFKNLKSLYKFWGILMIVVLAFYALAIVFVTIGMSMMSK